MEARDHSDASRVSSLLDEEEAERESVKASAPDFDFTLAVDGWKAFRSFFHGGERFSDGVKECFARSR